MVKGPLRSHLLEMYEKRGQLRNGKFSLSEVSEILSCMDQVMLQESWIPAEMGPSDLWVIWNLLPNHENHEDPGHPYADVQKRV